jgi:CRISPR/Cas system-associated exonuclease Cas4 (RecB family)
MRPLRASEIGSYLYCRRAWWYRAQGVESANQTELSAGTELHKKHGRTVIAAGLMRNLALIVLVIALALLAWYGTLWFLEGLK